MMLCTEAGMTENTKGKTIKFQIHGQPEIVKVSRMDRLKITDDQVELALSAARIKYEATIKPAKDEYAARKKMMEVKALNEGRAKKTPSYYANIVKPKELENEPTNTEEENT